MDRDTRHDRLEGGGLGSVFGAKNGCVTPLSAGPGDTGY